MKTVSDGWQCAVVYVPRFCVSRGAGVNMHRSGVQVFCAGAHVYCWCPLGSVCMSGYTSPVMVVDIGMSTASGRWLLK